jgi:hypothetical protein
MRCQPLIGVKKEDGQEKIKKLRYELTDSTAILISSVALSSSGFHPGDDSRVVFIAFSHLEV